jgi:REP element-mobilizing transposase RayT
MILPEIQSSLYPYIGGIIRNYKGTLLEIGGMPDHIHILINLRNLVKHSDLIRDVKAHSTIMIRGKFPKSKDFEWQEGTGSFATSFSMVDVVRNYIKNQEEHHRTMTYEEEYIKFLKGHNIDFDPRFVLG